MKGIAVLMIVTLLSAFLDWRRGVHFALFLVVVEGVIRKWILPGQEMVILFLKDAVLLVAYIKYFSEYGFSRFERLPKPVILLIGISFVIGALDSLNPALSSPIVGFYGMKAYFFYVPLLWMGMDLFDNPKRFEGLLKFQLTLAIPVFVLAYIQFFSSADSILNTYAASMGEKMDVVTVGESGNIRVTGTFPYISGMGCFVNWITLLAIWSYLFSATKRLRTLGLIVLVMAIVAGLMTGSRSVVFFQLAFLAASLWVSRKSKQAAAGATLRLVFGGAVIGIILYKTVANQAVDAFMERLQGLQDTDVSFWGPLVGIWDMAKLAGIGGYGTGATHQARQGLEQLLNLTSLGQTPPAVYEAEYPRIMVELGPFGFAPWFILRVFLMVFPFIISRRVVAPALKSFCWLLGISMMLQYTIPNVFNHVYSLYFWTLAGVPLAMLQWQSRSLFPPPPVGHRIPAKPERAKV